MVFSSNVLEHIAHVRSFQSELLRVLKPDGIAVHLLPSAAWRFWTFAGHYPWLAKAAASRALGHAGGAGTHDSAAVANAARRHGRMQLLARIAIPPRHGEVGNSLTEHWHFSRHRWTPLFEETGWRVLSRGANRLIYTGHGLLGNRLGLEARGRLSRAFGSACHVYVLEKACGYST